MWAFISANWEIILSVILTLVGLVLTFFGIKKEGPVIRALRAFIKALLKSPESIAKAEKISDDPEEKKTFVLEQFELECRAEGVELPDAELVEASKFVDRQVKLSKEINVDSKKTAEEPTTNTITNKIEKL